jgi:enoyl-CoA hydratase
MSDLQVNAEGGVLRVIINRPAKRNALSRSLLKELGEVFAAGGSDQHLKAAVLRGSGELCFAAGGDLHELASITTAESAEAMATEVKTSLDAVRAFPLPVIASLNGDAMGGGAELALACDMRVAASHARIGFVQGRINVTTAWGGGADLMRLVGPSVGLQVLCQGEMIPAHKAAGLGLINRVADDGQTLDALEGDFLAPILRQAPQVLRAFKALASAARSGLSVSELNRLETRLFSPLWIHQDHWRAVEKLLPSRDS